MASSERGPELLVAYLVALVEVADLGLELVAVVLGLLRPDYLWWGAHRLILRTVTARPACAPPSRHACDSFAWIPSLSTQAAQAACRSLGRTATACLAEQCEQRRAHAFGVNQ